MNDSPHFPPHDGVDVGALDWARQRGIADEIIRRTASRVRRRRHRLTALSAVTGIVLLAALVTWNGKTLDGQNLFAAPPQSHVSIAKADQRVLPDGSVVDLNGEAQITHEFSDTYRRVTLTRGEAHFEVARDTARPFIVSANGVEVRAVGTAFSVGIGSQRVEVCVTAGTVSVASPASDDHHEPATPTLLDAGKRAIVEVNPTAIAVPAISVVDQQELRERQAWRVPRLEFVGTPLAEAVATFNEHATPWTETRLELGDERLGRLRLSGIIRADNTDILLRVLATEFGLTGHRNGNVITLRQK